MKIKTFYDERTSTLSYVVYDPESRDAVVIDPVLDYDAASSKTFTESADSLVDFIQTEQLRLHYVLETHAHADHLSASRLLKDSCFSAKVGVGRGITQVQAVFKGVFDLPNDFPTDGSQFDRLFDDGEVFEAGTLKLEVLFTPGHTPACVTYKVGDAVFTGDVLFMPDSGTGRCDFPGGNATDMYVSIAERIYTLPDETRIFVGHDYQPGGRKVAFETTVGEEKRNNVAITGETSREDFVSFREKRDKTLNAPKLLFQSVQVNVNAGRLPEPHANEIRYLKIPINVFRADQDWDREYLAGGTKRLNCQG